MHNLHSLKTVEVSLVGKGANGKKFAILKAAEPSTLETDTVEAVKNAPQGLVEKIRAVLKSFGKKPENDKNGAPAPGKPGQTPGKPGAMDQGTGAPGEAPAELTPGAQTALEAVGRILGPHKDEITDAHLDAVQEQVGIPSGDSGTGQGGEGDGEVKPEDMSKALEAAEKAYKETLEKLGYQKYPEGKLTMKKKKPGASDDDDDDDEGEEGEGDDMEKADILKADGTINVDAIPENMRPFAALVSKQMIESQAKATAAEARAVKLEKELVDQRVAVRKSELVSIAKGFQNLPEKTALTMLELADKEGAPKFDEVFKDLQAMNAQMGSGKLFSVLGSSQSDKAPGGNGGDIMAKVEKAIEGIVQKSAENGVPISKAKAFDAYLQTEEGKALYANEKNRREMAHPIGA